MAKNTNNKILVIDDHPITHRILENMFRAQGFEFTGAFDWVEGFDKARNDKPDLILLDILLPGVNGREITKRLKADPATKDIPIIFITVTLSKKDDKKDKTIVVDGQSYPAFAKPLYQPKLLSAIKKELKKSKADK